MNFEELIIKREAVRKFSNTAPSMDIITEILNAGRVAPSAKNMQPIKIYVATQEESLNKLDTVTPCRYNAPVCLIICGDESSAWHKEGEDYPTVYVDAAIAATHMMLEATNLGLDSTWIRYFDMDALKQTFAIPENITPVCLLNIGYRDADCPPNPNHNVRKELEDIVEYI